MKIVKSVEKIDYKSEKIDRLLSKFAIGCLVTSISLGTIGAINEIEKKKYSISIPSVSDEHVEEKETVISGIVLLDDAEANKVAAQAPFDHTGMSFESNDSLNSSLLLNDLFEQRPDLNVLYDNILDELVEIKTEINSISQKLDKNELKEGETYNDLLDKKASLIEERNTLNDKQNEIVMLASEYGNKKTYYKELTKRMADYKTNNNQLVKSVKTQNDIYSIKLMNLNDSKITELEETALQVENELYEIVNSSISIDDIKFMWKGYNSSCGYVPAGEWDTWLNPNYAGEGHLTGLIGSFQGIQGIETGYDSRKGAEKLNYGDPDRALLKLLSQVTDADGNILYPMESFEKGGKYYYHIFGINDDGTINYDLIDNPRFGLKMLGNYFIVGGDQRLLRERGSLVLTTLGPAIVIDNGEIPDLDIDPNHIDMSMDEVLFWLKNYSHNSDLTIKSMAGIYDWCTPDDFDGVVDVSYEIMERNYVNNLSITYDVDLICFFDRDEFFTETTYNGQADFALRLNR